MNLIVVRHSLKFVYRSSLVTEPPEGEEWNVREDHLLLDAVEMFGYGNWKDIARFDIFPLLFKNTKETELSLISMELCHFRLLNS